MFHTSIIDFSGNSLELGFEVGRITFLLGANGTGKSSLMNKVAQNNTKRISRIYSYRNVTLSSNSVSLTGQRREQYNSTLDNVYYSDEFRYKGDYTSQKVETILYDLHSAETKFSIDQLRNLKTINPATKAGRETFESVKVIASPFEKVQRVLHAAGLALSLSVDERGTMRASRDGCPPYGIQQLSDGERAAFLLAASIITAPPDHLILIDEPERHLHRSISSPLIHALLLERLDCSFVISTHDVGLPLDQPDCSALLLREYRHAPQAWRADYFTSIESIDEDIAEAILGSRRTIVFVEGTRNSLDQSLYQILFKNVTVRAQDTCSDVVNATRGVNDTLGHHWIRAVGVIDRDRRDSVDLAELKKHNVIALNVNSVESLYFHPKVVKLVAKRLDKIGLVKLKLVERRVDEVMLAAFSASRDTLIRDAVVRRIREVVLSKLPQSKDIDETNFCSVGLTADEVSILYKAECEIFDSMTSKADAEGLCSSYSVKKTGVRRVICDLLKIKDAPSYAETVRKMIMDEEEAAAAIRMLIGPLTDCIDATQRYVLEVPELVEQTA